MLICSLPIRGEQYKYVKGNTTFEIFETKNDYEIRCYNNNSTASSRNRNILDRKLRMEAVDIIGSYIIFKTTSLPSDLFSIYIESINLHYTAYMDGLRQEYITIKGSEYICYICEKNKYKIELATYNHNIDVNQLLQKYYSQKKDKESATLLYKHTTFTSDNYITFERDYFTSKTKLSQGIRLLQARNDRFELSVYSINDEIIQNAFTEAKNDIPDSKPHQQFYFEEMVTAAPIGEKRSYYIKWQKSLEDSKTIWEDFLLFCSKQTNILALKNDITIANTIIAYGGAISPFALRQPINTTSYINASQAYAQSDFEESVKILTDAINNEGISVEILNLLGASYRFLDNYQNAIPFLLLCFKLNPQTTYLTGNIALCAKKLNYPRLRELSAFLLKYSVDEWSKNEINK